MNNYELAVILFYCAACLVIGFIAGAFWYDGAGWSVSRPGERGLHAARNGCFFGSDQE